MVANIVPASLLLVVLGCAWGEHTEAVEVSANDVCVRSNRDHVECLRYEGVESGPTIDKPGDSYTQLGGGRYLMCGLTSAHEIECWGATNYGKTDPLPAGPFEHLDVGMTNGCGLMSDQTARCWGTAMDLLAAVDPSATAWRSLAVGDLALCGIADATGTITCWGKDWHQQGALDPPGGQWAEVWGGGDFFAARSDDGTFAMWGNNEDGELDFPEGLRFTDLALASDHSCALSPEGKAICWGSNERGQLEVPGGETFTDIDARGRFTCGVTTDHRLLCWGCYSDKLYDEGHPWCQTPTPSWDG